MVCYTNCGSLRNGRNSTGESIQLGVSKINIYSDMKYAYFTKAREILSTTEYWDPNVIYPDCIKEARKVINYKMHLFNSVGKANLYEQTTSLKEVKKEVAGGLY